MLTARCYGNPKLPLDSDTAEGYKTIYGDIEGNNTIRSSTKIAILGTSLKA
jgi:hypothetical protein